MMLGHKKNQADIIRIIRGLMPEGHYRIFYFGSRVNGRGTDRSDIDIGIEADKKLLPRTISEIKDKLEELPVLYKFDVVDFKAADDSFKRVALEKIEVIYEQ